MMPTYEYSCTKCHKTFERTQRMSDEALKKCVYCKGNVRRLIGAGGGLIFKGSGFYATDYKKQPAEGGSASGGKTEAAKGEPATGEKTAIKKETPTKKK